MFLQNPRAVLWYAGLSRKKKYLLRQHLEKVDPGSPKKITIYLIRVKKRNKNQSVLAPKVKAKDLKETQIAVRESIDQVRGASVLRFMDGSGLKSLLALCLAAGMTPEETAALGKMDISSLNDLVSVEDVKEARKQMPEAIVHAANQIVLKDLLEGEITDRTEKADRIVDRRVKQGLKAHGEKRKDRREEDRALSEQRRKHAAQRFGVPIEAEVVEEAGSEDSTSE